MTYGTLAYTGTNPIGGGEGYVSQYDESHAHEAAESWTDLKKLAKEMGYQKEIWIPNNLVMHFGDDHPTFNPGVILASNRGVNGAPGAKLKNPFTVGGSGNYMSPIAYFSPNCVLSGLVLEGPGSFAATTDSRTNAAVRMTSGGHRVEIENCELLNFFQGGVYIPGGCPTPWNSDALDGRHWIHHSTIHGMQRHGFGYGVQVESGGSFLLEACIAYDCRHLVCASQTAGAGFGNCYELRFNIFGEAWYRYYGTGALHNNHQIDCHGFGASSAGSAGGYLWIHHNDFAANNTYDNAPNVAVRGIPHFECRVWANRTRKLHDGKSGVFDETSLNQSFTLRGSDGGDWNGSNDLAKYKMFVTDNQYGEWTVPEPPEPPIEVNTPDIQVVSLEADEVIVGERYEVKATVTNAGNGAGEADITIGFVSGDKKFPLKTETVSLEPGASAIVLQSAIASTVGEWTFYCDAFTVVLRVVEPPPPVAILALTEVSATVIENSVSVSATVNNTGNAPGTATVTIEGGTYTVEVAAGESKPVEFTLGVEMST
jgi:hypothetical protein